MKLLLCLTDLPPEKFMKKYSILDVTDDLVDIHVQFSQTRFQWELDHVLSRPSLFKPTLEDKFAQVYKVIISELKGNNVICDTRLQVLLPAIEDLLADLPNVVSLLTDFSFAIYLPKKSKESLAKKVFARSSLLKIQDEEGLAKWLA